MFYKESLMLHKLPIFIAVTLLSLPVIAQNTVQDTTQDTSQEAEWEKNAEANRVFVQNLFTPSWKNLFQSEDSDENHFDSDLQEASAAWLHAIRYFAKHPDARFFLLADPVNIGREEIALAAINNKLIEETDEDFPHSYKFSKYKSHTTVQIDLSPNPYNSSWVLTYTAIPQADKSIIGIQESNASDRYMTSATTEFSHYMNGKLKNITPHLQEKDFYRSKVVPPSSIATNDTEDDSPEEYVEQPADCEMYIHFELNQQTNPIRITASYQQQNADHYRTAYVCVAECEIPFTWNGTQFIAGKKNCLNNGEWGIFPPRDR